ncbi:MAG: GNAT family N-acetyltransferase [Chitinophaga sp.]|uniref:GNAT family N-acetyltransferase n=1 Tax=Chitinophaga sp. TaxID=1869181 RepID=UPI0025BEE2FB|nr:GNAT family protein [Chitinophaga sp.]MBV8252360.1 GNAT family N-acetyltransferase [Chitinophaga sp.]
MYTIQTLTGKNDITLKAIAHSDLPELAILANEPAIAANLRDSFPSPSTLETATNFHSLISQGKVGHVWGIYVKDKLAGVISLIPQTDIYRHSAEIGYWLGLPYHGKGIMPVAVSLVTDYGFQELHIHRIYAGVFAYNEASKKVLMKCGYQLEAIKKQGVIKNGIMHDEHVMVRLKG